MTRSDTPTGPAYEDLAIDILNHGLLSVLVSIGHRTRLFDALGDGTPMTSVELAERAGLTERYVREWLAAMACGRLVAFDPTTGRFQLPPEGRACLTRAAGVDNIAGWMSMVGFLAPVEDDIVRCFRHGGGLGYDHYPKFAKAMAVQSAMFIDGALVEGILPLVPGLVDALESGIDVCDIGCGAGHAANVIARAFPRSHVRGIDLLAENIDLARTEAGELGLTNADFAVEDAATLDATGRYDLVTSFIAIHDQAHPDEVLARIARSLRPGGWYLCVDSHASSELTENLGDDVAAFRYAVSTLHCMSVSLAHDGMGLGDCWGPPRSVEMMHDAGFTTVELITPGWLQQYHVYCCRVR